MNAIADPQLTWFFGGIAGVLAAATAIGRILRLRAAAAAGTMENLEARITAWWLMFGLFAAAILTGRVGALVLFALVSFLALREFITLTPTRRGDHRAVFYAFFAGIPLQYWLVGIDWYGLFAILIPVYAFLYIPTRSALSGDTERFLERVAEIQWGLMVCVYCVSHAPAILMLEIPGYAGRNATLLLYLVVIVEVSDVLQYVFGKLLGRHPITPTVSPGKTWEGFVGGILGATVIGTLLCPFTPFAPWQAAAMSLVVTLVGFAGGLTMSAIKRDRGVKDWGTAVVGHGGVLDRIDSLCFAAPVFFHLTRFFFTP